MPPEARPSNSRENRSVTRIAACPTCAGQYDVSDLDSGQRFHCSCGELITVPEPRAHEATVVRCSSCGGPRQGLTNTCSFCGSGFTLHERDLHTICPGCASRISDRARFCHSCGLAIAPQGAIGAVSEARCPACPKEQRLSSRQLGGEQLAVLECLSCAGLWLGKEVFQLLEERSRDRQTSWNPPPPHAESASAGRQSVDKLYRRCPFCDQMMHRRNFGRRSGVIIDLCGRHGLWFDHGELEKILRWIRRGGLARAEQLELEKRQDVERMRASSAGGSPLFADSRTSSTSRGGLLGNFVGGLLDFFF